MEKRASARCSGGCSGAEGAGAEIALTCNEYWEALLQAQTVGQIEIDAGGADEIENPPWGTPEDSVIPPTQPVGRPHKGFEIVSRDFELNVLSLRSTGYPLSHRWQKCSFPSRVRKSAVRIN